MGLRDRIQERRDDRSGAVHFQMRQKLVSIGDDYWIEDSQGNRVYKVDGKALRIRDTLKFEDANGTELLKIQQKVARIRDTMKIENANGDTVASVRKAMISPIRERWHVEVEGGPDLKIKGNIVDHEYSLERDGATVAEVSKRWFRVADTYGVEVAPGEDPVLALAITAVIDSMAHEDR